MSRYGERPIGFDRAVTGARPPSGRVGEAAGTTRPSTGVRTGAEAAR
ncbi:hypothetical protein JOF59_000635 [Streptomyces clavifer]|uniref:Uncharacterized protein n=1 Tax=Streptomyces clavifer TaxID=68188 RepID=A0ABS4V2U2_9ACTN|nr:hypothetical protein [Streptomyces clavifer]MBP2358235.1 hypothetical protein [Streptomyces clavifer]